MSQTKAIAVITALLACPQAFGHSGVHAGPTLPELWHTLSAPDHAAPLLIVGGLVAAAFWLALRHRSATRKIAKAPAVPRR